QLLRRDGPAYGRAEGRGQGGHQVRTVGAGHGRERAQHADRGIQALPLRVPDADLSLRADAEGRGAAPAPYFHEGDQTGARRAFGVSGRTVGGGGRRRQIGRTRKNSTAKRPLPAMTTAFLLTKNFASPVSSRRELRFAQ